MPLSMRASFAIRGHQRRRAPQLWLLAAALTVCACSFAVTARAADASATDAAASHPTRTGSKSAPEVTAFELANQMRDQMESVPETGRTRAEYTSVMDAYRSIYHNTPRDAKAPDSIYAVAQLLAEQGRVLGDVRSSQAAVGQYEFLRQQYPTTSFRINALLAEGEVEQNDLHDAPAAQAKFTDLLRSYPRSAQADDARAALAGLAPQPTQAMPTAAPAEQVASATHPSDAQIGSPAANTAATSTMPTASPGPFSSATPAAMEAAATPAAFAPANETSHAGHPVAPGGALAQVTSILYWSTPAYTRIVVQLGADVPYSSRRVPNPDRIYFDLHGAHLAHDLVGTSVDVTDNGYLKRIRVAQFSNNVARVVLDVNEVTDYSSFILSNPLRLIIDIRSRAQVGLPPSVASNAGGGLPAEATMNSATNPASALPQTISQAPVSQPSASRPSIPPSNAPLARTSQMATSPERATPNMGGPAASRTSQPKTSNATPAEGITRQNNGYARPPDTPITTHDPATGAGAASETIPGIGAAAGSSGSPVAPLPPSQTAGPTKPQATAALSAPPLPMTISKATPAPASTTKKSKGSKSAPVDDASPAHAADVSAGERSLVRALGLKIGRIVIDAGHGGHDSGTLGPGGIEEKDVVLDVALRLGNLLRERLGAEVIYTRDDDTFIPLEERTAIANQAKADLFISIHANSSSDPGTRGIEVYYLNFTSQTDALEVAARENAVANGSIYELSDLVKKITLKDKLDESRQFAFDVDTALYSGLQKGNSGLKDRGVKKAPFMVLIGANMPSILAEISFITNPKDSTLMRDPTYDQRIAEALYRGVAKYIGSLSGMRIAQTGPPAPAKGRN